VKTVLKWGKEEIFLSVPDRNVLAVLEPSGGEPVADLAAEVARLVKHPTAGPSLEEIVAANKAKTAAIIVNDMTRSTPTAEMLPPLLEELERLGVPSSGIAVVVATGTHRPMSDDETRQTVGDAVFAKYRVENHDCDSPDLVDMGTLSTGNRLMINRTVAEADLRLAIGEVLLHYYAGFAGGRKSILPGVSGRETVMTNHRMMTAPGVGIGVVDGNVLSEEMVEAVRDFCPLHFIFNCVSDSSKHIVRVVCGHWYDAWREGIVTFRKFNFAPIAQKADVVFLSAGGFPKDINMYQAQKALDHADKATKKGGAIVLVADCPGGYGEAVFEEWMNAASCPEDVVKRIRTDFKMGGHKAFGFAKVAAEKTVYMVTSMDGAEVKKLFAVKVPSVEEALRLIERERGPDFSCIVMPEGSLTVPVPPRG